MIAAILGPRSGGFRRLWLAALISLLGTWVAAVVLPLRVYDSTGSTVWVSALFVAEIGPAAVVGLLAANRLSRLPVRRTLVGCDLVAAAAYLLLVWVTPPWPTFGLALVAGFAAGVRRPMALAAIPRMVADDELAAANAALAMVEWVMVVAGQVAGGVAFTLIGPGPSLAINAASFVFSAMLVAGLWSLSAQVPAVARRLPVAQLRHSIALIARSRVLVDAAVVWPAACLFVGMGLALQIPFVRFSLHGSAAAVGLALASISAGLVGGSAVARRVQQRLAVWFPGLVAVMGACLVAASAAHRVPFALVPLALVGAANGMVLMHVRLSLQRGGEPEDLPGLAAAAYAAISVMTVLGAVGGGVLAGQTSVRTAFAVAGCGTVAVAVVTAVARIRRSVPVDV